MKVGSHVLYSTKGICKVERTDTLKLTNVAKEYYILIPVFDKNSTYYLPIDYDPEKIVIRNAINLKTVDELMDYSKVCEPFEWLENVNLRKNKNEEILKSADHKSIIRLIKTLKQHEEGQKSVGKKMYLSDTKVLKSAIRIISNEFAFVRGEDPQVIEEFFDEAV